MKNEEEMRKRKQRGSYLRKKKSRKKRKSRPRKKLRKRKKQFKRKLENKKICQGS